MGQEKNRTISYGKSRPRTGYISAAAEDVEGAGSVSRTESDGGGGGGPKERLLYTAINLTFLTGSIWDFASSISAREKSWQRC